MPNTEEVPAGLAGHVPGHHAYLLGLGYSRCEPRSNSAAVWVSSYRASGTSPTGLLGRWSRASRVRPCPQENRHACCKVSLRSVAGESFSHVIDDNLANAYHGRRQEPHGEGGPQCSSGLGAPVSQSWRAWSSQ